MAINIRIRDGLCPDPSTGDGGATEGDIRGAISDIIDTVGVKDLAGGHCLVTENSPAAMSVLVAPGVVYIPNANYDELDSNTVKFWEAIITVSTTVVITANTSGSTRIDLICAKMDTTIIPDEHASNIATLVVVQGTPGAGAPTLPDNHAKLAEVEVADDAVTIVTADITDSRVQAKINSDYLLKATGDTVNTGTDDTTIVTPKAIADSKLADYIRGDGWVALSGTFTYASATTINTPTDLTAYIQKGDKLKFTQHGTVKYFYVIAITSTLLTVTAGSNYSVENTATYPITLPYYSHAENPIGFPTFFNTTLTYISGGQFNSDPICTFALVGKYCILNINLTNFSVTGSGAAIYSSPIPVTSGGSDWYGSVMTGGQPIYFTTANIGIDKAFGVGWAGGESGIYGMGVLIFRY